MLVGESAEDGLSADPVVREVDRRWWPGLGLYRRAVNSPGLSFARRTTSVAISSGVGGPADGLGWRRSQRAADGAGVGGCRGWRMTG